MILRRVTKHVKDQNWFAVLLDFLIVVAGVFVGIQVSNWNQTRTDHNRANDYLERISTNLETDVQTYNDRMDFWNKVTDYGLVSLHYAETREQSELSNWDLVLAFFQASQTAEFHIEKTTYSELTSAGELGLIENIAIRNMIAKYYSAYGNFVLVEIPKYREHIRGYIPIDVQNYIWMKCYSNDKDSIQVLLSCKSPISEEKANEILSEIVSEVTLIRQLRYWVSTMNIATLISRAQILNAQQLLNLIQVELSRQEKSQ